MPTWAEICADPHLKDLPYKIETNRFNKILMSPAFTWHGRFQYRIGRLLEEHMPQGCIIIECAVETSDGTKVPDVVWISEERYAPYHRAYSLPIAPEICVEILSASNTREEMLGKMQLYFATGAKEVWLCDENGRMEFFDEAPSVAATKSRLCPVFPERIE